jgi:hypothetical protein
MPRCESITGSRTSRAPPSEALNAQRGVELVGEHQPRLGSLLRPGARLFKISRGEQLARQVGTCRKGRIRRKAVKYLVEF